VLSCCPERFARFVSSVGSVGVGVRGGLEAAIHSFSYHLDCHKDNPDMCAVKIDMYNAFNEVQHAPFLCQVNHHFPGIYSWVKWCYQYPFKLQLGPLAFKCSRGIQKGDPFGPLLFSLVLLDLLESITIPPDISFQLWYLDDGTLVGSRTAVAKLLSTHGPSFGLSLYLKKCEVFWPSGDQSFPSFPQEVSRSLVVLSYWVLLFLVVISFLMILLILFLIRFNFYKTSILKN